VAALESSSQKNHVVVIDQSDVCLQIFAQLPMG